MTTKEEIMKLAEECGIYMDAATYPANARELKAFYQAARKPLEEEIELLKTVPMKYRRMQFNAQLQDENNKLRQQLAAANAEIEQLIEKNQNLFSALMVSTQKKDNLYKSIRSASGHLNLYGLFSCVEGDSYDPECADKNVRKANSILKTELTTEIIKPAGKEDQAVCDSILKEQYK